MSDASRTLLAAAEAAVEVRCAPYGARREAVVLLFSDGAWAPGVRLESASFGLTLPPLNSAVGLAVAAGRRDAVAVAFAHTPGPTEAAYLEATPFGRFVRAEPRLYRLASDAALPPLGGRLSPYCDAGDAGDFSERLQRLSARAYTPESDFPVAALLELSDGRCIPGVNVEHPEWQHIVCAERNALGAACSYGLTPEVRRVHLLCVRDPGGSPCGACRQLLAEQLPGIPVVLHGGGHTCTTDELLPLSFSGTKLNKAHLR